MQRNESSSGARRYAAVWLACGALALGGVGACGDNTQATGDGGNRDGSASVDAPMNLGDGGGPGDATINMSDGNSVNCTPVGGACVSSASCCVGATCDATSHTCEYPAAVCGALGATCTVATDCCSLTCSGGKCGNACKTNGTACAASGDCCSGNCASNVCAPVVTGGCGTLGNKCATNTDCCSQNCQGGLCANSGGGCNAVGDVCYKSGDCCTGLCNQPNGPTSAGTCGAVPPASGSGGCTVNGSPCNGCDSCCSKVCATTPTGGHVCQPVSGCRVVGDLCKTDADCCGMPAGSCAPIPGSTLGQCRSNTGNNLEGDVCLLMNAPPGVCGSQRADCANCLSPKWQCCKLDPAGVPRCFGGSTSQCPTGYTGQAPCCIAAGQTCVFSAECCNGAPCVADSSGALKCGATCSMANSPCRADIDCCPGLQCNIPIGQIQGTCGTQPPAPQPDGGTPPPSDGGVAGDMAPPPNSCSLVGQGCSTTQACCTGLTCAPAGGVGTCAPGQTGCSCISIIG